MLVCNKKPPFYVKAINKFVKQLNNTYPIYPTIKLVVLDEEVLNDIELDREGQPLGVKGCYGVYNEELGEILIAAGMFYPKHSSFILYIIAHEFCHVLDYINPERKVIREMAADAFAFKEVDLFIQEEEDASK